ncbi:hypothetical protein [Streptomyces sp. NPDC018031]|uniref:hypothetical protein n=1 Tax=Streptomyces sp. NPDC018031 TaxID=3365033 RepID=UPI0037975BE3
METRHTGQVLRALRAAVFAAVCVLPATLGHALMSGTAVPWWTVAAAFGVTGGAAWALAGRERGPLLVTAATVGAQLVLHNVFSLAQRAATGPVVARPAPVGGAPGTHCGSFVHPDVPPGGGHHHHHGGTPDAGAAAELPGTLPGMDAMHHGHGGLGMWSVHVVVALLCGIWLSGGEHAVHRLGRTLAVRLFAPLTLLFRVRPVGAGAPRVRVVRHHAERRPRRLLLVHAIVTRGPPRAAAV